MQVGGVSGARTVGLADGTVDITRQLVRRGPRQFVLTTREAELLDYLASRPGEAVSREELHTRVWGYSAAVVSRTVDTTVRRLRTKIELDPSQPSHLQTVHGRGYRFQPSSPPEAGAGRAAELERVEAAVAARFARRPGARSRVGVTGGPGVGKTWLARRVVRAFDAQVEVVWCDGEGASDPVALAQRVAAAARVPLGLGDPVAQVAELVESRAALFVLDGVTEGALDAVRAWDRGVVLFTTPRREEGLAAAWVELGPLSPDEAAKLFVDRYEALVRRTAASEPEASDPAVELSPALVAEIVARLDHLPLAIELAAGRLHLMSGEALLQRLDAPIRTLGGALHRSVSAAVAALPDAQRSTLAQVSAFRGAFGLDAAEEVVAGVPSVVDALHELCARSLVRAQRVRSGVLFTVPNTVRSGAGEPDPGLADRMRAWAERRSAAVLREVDGPDPDRALAALRAIAPDLRACPSPPPAVVAAVDVWLEIDGPVSERLAWLERHAGSVDVAIRTAEALRVAGQPDAARRAAAEALARATGSERSRAAAAAAAVAEHGVRELAEYGLAADPDPATAVRLWSAVARDARRRADDGEADHALRRALEVVRAAGVARFEAVVSTNLANLHRSTGHLVEAARLYHQARAAALRLGEVRIEAAALHNLAGLRLEQGAVDEAVGLAREALRVARRGGEVAVIAHVAHTLGHLLHHTGAHDEAEGAYLEAVGLLRRVDPGFACSAEGDLGALLADRGLVDAAARALAEVGRALAPDPVLRAVLELHLAHLDAARARDAGSGEEAERWRASGRARIASARAVGGPRCRSVALLAERVVEGR